MNPRPIDDPSTAPARRRTDRRRFLALGGSGVVAAAVLAACGSDEEPPGETGVTTVPPAETTLAPPQTTSPEDGEKQNIRVVRSARSFELAAVEIYSVLLGQESDIEASLPAPIAYDEEVEEALDLIRTRHRTHARDLVPVVASAGGKVVSRPNFGIIDGLLKPQLEGLGTQLAVLQFAESIETIGAGTYGWGAGTLTTPELRQDLMAIGTAAAGQASAVSLLIDPSGADAVPNATLDTSGPSRLPAHMLVEEDQDGDDITAEAPVEGEPEEGEDEKGGEGDKSGD